MADAKSAAEQLLASRQDPLHLLALGIAYEYEPGRYDLSTGGT